MLSFPPRRRATLKRHDLSDQMVVVDQINRATVDERKQVNIKLGL